MVYDSGYTYESLEPLMEELCALIDSAGGSKLEVNYFKNQLVSSYPLPADNFYLILVCNRAVFPYKVL